MEKLDFSESKIKRTLMSLNPGKYEYGSSLPHTTCGLFWVLFFYLIGNILFLPVFIPVFIWNWINYDNDISFKCNITLISFFATIIGILVSGLIFVDGFGVENIFAIGPWFWLQYAGLVYIGLIVLAIIIAAILLALFIIGGPIFYVENRWGWDNIKRNLKEKIVFTNTQEENKKPNALFEAIKSFKDKTCKPIKWN